MTKVLQQLQHVFPDFPPNPFDRTTSRWHFTRQINLKNKAFFEKLTNQRPILMAQYRIQCNYLLELYNNPNTPIERLLSETEATLVLSQLLEHIYLRLDEPQDVNQLRRNQFILKTLLAEQYPEFKNTQPPKLIQSPGITLHIRSQIQAINWYRLVAIRLRRLTVFCMLLPALSIAAPWFNLAEPVVAPFFLYLGWVFFIPRLITNLFVLLHHLCSPKDALAHQLHWSTRLSAEINMHRRGFELINDAMWFSSGIVACFALLGGFLLWRTPLAIIMQSFDLFVSVARAGLELNRLSLLEKQYQENSLRDKITPNPDYLRILYAHQRYQYEFHGLAVMNNLILIVSILTILPCFVSISPLIPIFGALLALSASAIMNRESVRIQKQRPKDDLNGLTKHGFFKPSIPHVPTTNTNEHPLSLPGPLL